MAHETYWSICVKSDATQAKTESEALRSQIDHKLLLSLIHI